MNRILFTLIAILFAGAFLSATLFNSGSPGHKTGSPLDVNTCTQCHGGNATEQTGWITTNIPDDGYTPGETYTIMATGTHSGAVKVAFELTAETPTSKTGEFIITNSTETKLNSAQDGVTNTSQGNTAVSGTKTWSINWVAPAIGTGDVIFYAAFVGANGNGNNTGDVIYKSKLSTQEKTTSIISGVKQNGKISIYPNPTTNYFKINGADVFEKIMIYNIAGKLVLSANNTNYVDVRSLNNGVYLVKIDNNNFIKLIVK